MDLQVLKIFCAVARLGSFSAASHELTYAQSYISTKIQALESDLNTTLFYRTNRGVTLTHKGEELLAYAQEILSMSEKAQKAMMDDGIATGSLRLGSLETIAQAHLPLLLSKYHSENPEVNLSITTGDSDFLTASVLDRTLDAAFVSGFIRHPDLNAKFYKTEHMLLASAPLDTIKSWDDLNSRTMLVFHSGCYYRGLLEQFLHENTIVPNNTIEFNSVGAVIASLCAGVGVSLLPESILSQYAQSNLLHTTDLPKQYSEVRTYLIYRKDTYINTAFSNFISSLKPACSKSSPNTG